MDKYYKVTKTNGETLYNHDGKNIVYKPGMIIEEPNYVDNSSIKCAKGIYVVTPEHLPLWWQDYDTTIWTVDIIGRSHVEVGKGNRCKKVKIGKKLTKRQIESLGKKYNFNWYERSQITDKTATQTAGDHSTQTVGYHSTQTVGDHSTQTAGDRSTQTAGYRSTQTAGYHSTQTAGYHSTQTAGDRSTQTAGYHSTQTVGNDSTQIAGDRSTQTVGYHSTQTAGNDSTQTAGINTVQIGYWYDKGIYKIATRIVTEKEMDKTYKFNNGIWTII